MPEDYQQLNLLNEITNSIDLPVGLLVVKNNGDIVIRKVPVGVDGVLEKFRLCKKCGVALYSIVSPTGELVGYKCFKCGIEEKVKSSLIAQFIDS